MTRYVTLPATQRRVRLGSYVAGIKLAKAHPQMEFRSGLDCWWPVTGAEIVRQYRRAMHRRISDAIPYSERPA